ncbi:hypothetical protein Sjap_002795 [Stephania japonica]|uniref:Uncharacterized protein n=1 Tax=Stephania japonica TaxID=461633 RepID=A0AAP0KNF6_9MAGN
MFHSVKSIFFFRDASQIAAESKGIVYRCNNCNNCNKDISGELHLMFIEPPSYQMCGACFSFGLGGSAT